MVKKKYENKLITASSYLIYKCFSLLLIILMPSFTYAEEMLTDKLTPAELAAFDEAPNLFKIKKLPSIANVQVKRVNRH